MIDIHSHLLPGVDDGSPSVEISAPVLARFQAEGVRELVLTPHLNASQAAAAPYERHAAILADLRRRVTTSPTLHLGWEIMLDAPGIDLSAPELTLGASRALLVEFTRGGLPRGASTELRRIARSGRTPVLAHPERYFGCTIEMVREWRTLGVVIQTDVSVLLGRGTPAQFAAAMLREGLIDILASDNHGDARTLAAAPAWLASFGASDVQIELLTSTNAALLLADEETAPVLPMKRGMIDNVKRLFGR